MTKTTSTLLFSAFVLGTVSALWAQPSEEERKSQYASFKKTDLATKATVQVLRDQYKQLKAPSVVKAKEQPLPKKVDHRSFSVIWDQGSVGSCTAQSLGQAVFSQERQKAGANASQVVPGSRLWLYYKERVKEGTILEDSGAMIGTGVVVLHTLGLPDEKLWPHDTKKWNVSPVKAADDNAKKRKQTDPSLKANDYIDVSKPDSLTRMKRAIANGYRIVSGIAIYESFEAPAVYSKGFVPVPDTTKEEFYGGHAVCAVGYDDTLKSPDGKYTGHFIFANSWGTTWGDKGFFYVPYTFMQNPDLNWETWKIDDVVGLVKAPVKVNPKPAPAPAKPAPAPAKPAPAPAKPAPAPAKPAVSASSSTSAPSPSSSPTPTPAPSPVPPSNLAVKSAAAGTKK